MIIETFIRYKAEGARRKFKCTVGETSHRKRKWNDDFEETNTGET